MNVADIFIAIGMAWFLFAEIRQLKKIVRLWSKKHVITSVSLTHLNWKIIAILSSMIGFVLAKLWMSLIVIILECSLTIVMVKLISDTRNLSLKQYMREWL